MRAFTTDATRGSAASAAVSGPVERVSADATACAARLVASDCEPRGIAIRSEPIPGSPHAARLPSVDCMVGN